MTRNEILAAVAGGKLSLDDAGKLLDILQGQNHQGKLMCKVSEKGGVSVYGLQRMPVTLYGEQWTRLAEFIPTVMEFVKANDAKLSKKGDAKAAPKANVKQAS